LKTYNKKIRIVKCRETIQKKIFPHKLQAASWKYRF
jgi:hypothetical protein